MSSAPSDVRNRISAAIQRASGLEEKLRQDRLDPQIVSSPVLNRIVGDMRKLARELQLAFEDLSQSIAEQMQAKETATAAQRLAAAVFRLSPTPCIVTDTSAAVIDINPAASQLLNVTARHIAGRSFVLFLGGDRLSFMELLSHTRTNGDVQRCEAHIRPRERAPFDATILVAPDPSEQVLLMLLPPRIADTPLDDAQAAVDLLERTYNLKSRRGRIAGGVRPETTELPERATSSQ
jgi:PAS domain-containing protein